MPMPSILEQYIWGAHSQPSTIPMPPKYNVEHPKGNFCGVLIDGLPQFNSPTKNLFYGPSYGCFNDAWRREIRRSYVKTFGEWATLPIFVQSRLPYDNKYPMLDARNAQQWCDELLNDKIISTYALFAEDQGQELNAIIEDTVPLAGLKTCFLMWEQNEYELSSRSFANKAILARKSVPKDCLIYVHFSPDHGAGIVENFWYDKITGEWRPDGGIDNIYCENNSQWWNWAKLVGICGLHGQADVDWDLATTNAYRNVFTERFGTGLHGYPIGMFYDDFEIKAHNVYYGVISVWDSNKFNSELRKLPTIGMVPNGYCNG